MQKVTLMFPNHDSLWLFTDRAKAINVAITPRKNTITGMFSSEEVDIAVKEFQAVQINDTLYCTNTSSSNQIEIRTSKPLFKFSFSQLLSLLNL